MKITIHRTNKRHQREKKRQKQKQISIRNIDLPVCVAYNLFIEFFLHIGDIILLFSLCNAM